MRILSLKKCMVHDSFEQKLGASDKLDIASFRRILGVVLRNTYAFVKHP